MKRATVYAYQIIYDFHRVELVSENISIQPLWRLISEDPNPNRKDLSIVIEESGLSFRYDQSKAVDPLFSNRGNSTSYRYAF